MRMDKFTINAQEAVVRAQELAQQKDHREGSSGSDRRHCRSTAQTSSFTIGGARGLKLVLEPEAQKLLAEEGYDPEYGARPLERVIQQRLKNPLAGRILSGVFAEGDTIHIRVDASNHAFSFEKGVPAKQENLVAGVA